MKRANTVPAIAHPLLDRYFGGGWRDGIVEAVTGTTNFVSRLELAGRKFALRVPRIADSVTGVDRRSEFAALRVAAQAGLAPEVAACDETTGVLITHWIEGGYWSREHACQPPAIATMAAVFRRLHALVPAPDVRTVRVDAVIDHYLAELQPGASAAIDRCRSLHGVAREHLAHAGRLADVLCHNDLHHRNIVETRDGIRLLDWEYSGLGAAMFDLAGYASYQHLDDAGTAALLQGYGAADDAARTFPDWRWLFEYIWALWLAATDGRGRELDSLLPRLHGEVV